LILTTAGSHTNASMLSAASSFTMSTPYQIPPTHVSQTTVTLFRETDTEGSLLLHCFYLEHVFVSAC
jgi:hypothetical protein